MGTIIAPSIRDRGCQAGVAADWSMPPFVDLVAPFIIGGGVIVRAMSVVDFGAADRFDQVARRARKLAPRRPPVSTTSGPSP